MDISVWNTDQKRLIYLHMLCEILNVYFVVLFSCLEFSILINPCITDPDLDSTLSAFAPSHFLCIHQRFTGIKQVS